MINEAEFRKKYCADIPFYRAWGNIVNKILLGSLSKKLGSKKQRDSFLRIPPKPRIKEIDSLVSKAFYRNKKYKNPYEEITDKVGVRYVVLLKEQINIVKKIVEDVDIWSFSKDRDYEKEKKENPLIFDYQSVHYIVRNIDVIQLDNLKIPENTPCEIQIRTLLQHAHCELTHDITYKPVNKASSDVKRSISKSMALIEMADDLFEEVNVTIRNENEKMNGYFTSLKSLYSSISPSNQHEFEEKVNFFILDAYKDKLESYNIKNIEDFVSKSDFIKDVISKKSEIAFLYSQPISLFIFYMIGEERNYFRQLWPLTENDLIQFYTDLGISFDPA
jgi:putative GTP pyrophosphokinase